MRTENLWTWPLLFVVVAGILFCRLPSAISHPAFCDEDGVIFFKQGYEQGAFSVLFLPYNGCLQIVPRSLAALASLFPLRFIPGFYAWASLVLAAAVFTFFYSAKFRPIIASDSVRAGVILLFTLMPNSDSLMRLAYLPWYMLWLIILVVLMELPRSSWRRGLLLGALTLAIWSTPVAVVCLPLIGLRLWRAPDRKERIWWAVVIFLIVAYALTADRGALWNLWQPDLLQSVVHAIGYRVFCFFFLGSALAKPLLDGGWEMITRFSLLLAGVCLLAAVWMAAEKRRPSEKRPWASFILLYLIIALPTLFVLRPQWVPDFLTISEQAWRWHQRYFFCSTLLLCVFAGMMYESVRDWLSASLARRGLAIALLLGWISLHTPTFFLEEWRIKPGWKHFAREIQAAEIRANESGTQEIVRIPNAVKIWAFDLVVAKKK